METTRRLESGIVITCPSSGAPSRPLDRRSPPGRYFLATFAAEPSATVYPCRGFLMARPIKGRRFEIEDTRNTRKGVESFGLTLAPRIPSMREMIAMVDSSLNLGGEEFGPALSTWQETLRQRYCEIPRRLDVPGPLAELPAARGVVSAAVG